MEFEFMRVIEKAGNTRRQDMSHYGEKWGYGQQLLWSDTKMGDKLTIALPVKDAGRYDVVLQVARANDYGIIQVSLDGEKIGEPIDCYNTEVKLNGEVKLGAKELTAGEHKLTVELVGTNEKTKGRYLAGLDYIRLVPAK